MRIEPKSPDVLAAQFVAYYTDFTTIEVDPRVMNMCVNGAWQYEDGDLSLGLDFIAKDYIEYLRQVGGSQAPVIQHHEGLFRNFSTYQGIVDQLGQSALSQRCNTLFDDPAYLGSGEWSDAFLTEDAQGNKVVIRKVKDPINRASEVADHLAVDFALRDLESNNTERLLAASPLGFTVAKLVPGKPIVDHTDLVDATQDQLVDLFGTIIAVNERSVYVDVCPGNILFDPSNGFGIIDMIHSGKPYSSKKNIEQFINNVGGGLSELCIRAAYSAFQKVKHDVEH